ncbi:MAG TPA: DUF1361 domain-containing protein [Cyanobacteria bacterium UBA11149]|nr:DUF1361 domain-containing protein [Cyanobacteria bacterium UBA11367]HBE57204.1 DUF1361 domain-containing protein [Cyanobacteria bacterium UBA11366]HBK66227.1 DUF1361 domain-containing protein [Cyanobacteria bacterium UBA11166]HBR75368.1 DUF1361 domain-containing protein [Cyanobacteria bacterium UBA11159]HBS72286.1 DUF1361 domain-containing protein [Cyanobacteria bacterium UBA11153]HBW90508.1 DUF1361 domain-containing protein [Cyanobacteria bacterium UBA11149]HCA93899.1 DUF1361 domain-conta
MEGLIAQAWAAWHHDSGWMAWNLFLAFIPLALSFWLFRRKSASPSIFWWVGFVVFIAFLPNAPYLLTDIVHLIGAIRARYSIWVVTLVLIPQHLSVILIGFEAYILSLINQGHYLKQQKMSQWILPAELFTHALCAVGIYLGRFLRFNSWDLVTQPDDLARIIINDLTAKRPLFVMLVTFIVLTVLYWLMKQVTLGVIIKIRYRKAIEKSSLEN